MKTIITYTKSGNGDDREDGRRAIMDVAENLYRTLGYQKTTVADIARELRMSPANIYRFFVSKAEINEAVAGRLLARAETMVADIASGPAAASDKLRACIVAIEQINTRRALSERKLHELVAAAFDETWPTKREHAEAIERLFSKIISEGNESGEFRVPDCDLAALLVGSACARQLHPRLAVECARETEPTTNQTVDFCLVALKGERPAAAKRSRAL